MKRGDKFQYELPKWICNGEIVTVTVTKMLHKDFNFYDAIGEYTDSTGQIHTGKFRTEEATNGTAQNTWVKRSIS